MLTSKDVGLWKDQEKKNVWNTNCVLGEEPPEPVFQS
jgi:hypothetical protein